MNNKLTILEKQIKDLNLEVGRLQGQKDLYEQSIHNNKSKLIEIKKNQEIYQKAVEILNFVQEQTRNKIKKSFEEITTYALKYIYSSHYKFTLDFDRRGNLGTMNFNIQTPEFTELADPSDTSGGGVLDICALALRIVLLELSIPRIEGCIILDESLKHLSEEYLPEARKFLEEISKKMNRQIIMITHKQELINNAEYAIKLGC